MKTGRNLTLTLIITLIISAVMISCEKGGGGNTEPEKQPNIVHFYGNKNLAPNETYPEGTQINILSKENWTIDVNYTPSAETGWITLSDKGGNGFKNVTISNKINTTFDRTAVITIKFETSTEIITINQKGQYAPPPQSLPVWTELPETKELGNMIFIPHYCDLPDGRRVRNYSMLYDPSTYTSYWVAYPLHVSYITKNVPRGRRWAYDPSLPYAYQLDWSEGGFGAQAWDRGHQIPSADRTTTEQMNDQTFYYTNVTPQRWQLNQQKWEKLEEFLRNKIIDTADSMWVVTGAVFQDRSTPGEEDILYLNNRKNGDIDISVPNYYYKVALWQKTVGSDKKYTAVGFWMDNVDTGGTISSSDAFTVREIEQKTGFNFFANLPQTIQDQVEVEVVSTDWFTQP